MNYLRVENISKHYGERVLFQNITFTIESGDKIALVAKNGTGKSSILNCISGKDQPDSGTIVLSKDITVAFLEQEPEMIPGMTVWDTLFNSNDALLQAIARYEKWMEQSEEHADDAVLAELQHAMEQMDLLNAWDYESRVKQILSKLNIHHYEQDVATLSGGQKKRLALARILIQQPDLVILDEPTNHLDLDMIEWLEGFLKSSSMALLMVTHDRYFLDAVCQEILELERGVLYTHKGNYSYYLEKKADREFREDREADKARNLMRKELEWMRKQPKARGTKSKSRIEAFYELEEKASKKSEDKQVQLQVKMQRMGSKVLELHRVSKQFKQGDREQIIVKDFSYILKPGERVGIVGKNGIGKTTFLNMIMGLEPPDSGRIVQGDTIRIAYYAQQGMELKPEKRVLDVVKDIAEYIELERGEKLTAAQLCRRFLFDDKMQHNVVAKLSGGEKRRLYLLTLLMQNPNFLILDEPTNDLDIDTLNVLEEFLLSFKGCILMVTHDRYFMDRLADHLLVFEGNGVVRDFNGNYQDYLNEQAAVKNAPQVPVPDKPVFDVKAEPVKRKLSFKEQREYELLSAEIAQLETEKTQLETELSKPDAHYESIQKWAAQLEQVKKNLETKEMRWLELDEWVQG